MTTDPADDALWREVFESEGMPDFMTRPPAEPLWWTLDYRPVVGILYRYFGRGDGGTIPLYVGVTVRPKERRAEHAKLDLWWPLVCHDLTETVEFTNEFDMYRAEDAELRDPRTIGLFNVREVSTYRRGAMAVWRQRGTSASATRTFLAPVPPPEPEAPAPAVEPPPARVVPSAAQFGAPGIGPQPARSDPAGGDR